MSDINIKKGHSNTNVTSQGALLKKSVFMEPAKLIFTNNNYRDDGLNPLTGTRSVIDYQGMDEASTSGLNSKKRRELRRRQIN